MSLDSKTAQADDRAAPVSAPGRMSLGAPLSRWAMLWVCALGLAGCLDDEPESPRLPLDGGVGDAGGGAGGQGGEGGGMGGAGGGMVGCVRTFVYRHPGADAAGSVMLGGPFESPPWSGAIALSDDDGDGFWTTNVTLPAGEHIYKFIVDGQWILDPDNPQTQDDGMGNANSVAVHGCPHTPDCLRDADCGDPTPLCRNYTCVEPGACSCPGAQVCDDAGQCVDPPECDAETPCADPLVCRDGACEPECLDDDDCEGDAVCLDLACVQPECAQDAECSILSEVCDGVFCVDAPCARQVFTFDPGADQFAEVLVSGEFNGWAETAEGGAAPMTFLPDEGVWFTALDLDNGAYQYKLVLLREAGGAPEWIADPTALRSVDDGFGGQNSIRDVDCMDMPPGPGVCGDLAEFDWADAVMYFAMIDRFEDGDGRVDPVPGATGGDAATGPSGQYEGGDLRGATNRVPYLRDLGVTAIWLSAPYENRDTAGAAIDPNQDQNVYSAYHGYWPSPANIDFTDPANPVPVPEVESRIGTADDLHAFVDAAHGAEIKVLFDYVMNHVDSESALYQAHRDWFASDNGRTRLCGPENLWDDPFWGTRCAFTDYLPPFDFDNPAARAWSVADAVWWATEFNIDGYRLDAIKHVSLTWLTDLRRALNAAIAEPAGDRFYLVGETFAYDDRDLLASFVDPDTMLDGQFDFPFKARVCEALFNKAMRLQDFAGWMDGNDGFYGPGALMTTWIGNHDIPRPIHFASGQIGNCRQGSFPGNGWTADFRQPDHAAPYERLGLSFVVMMTNPGIPLIYYGDEIGLAGGGDPDNRRMMPANDDGLNPHQLALREQVAALGRIRNENKVIARGRRITLSADEDTWVYRLTGCGTDSPDVTVAINRADQARQVRVPAGPLTDLLNGAALEGGQVELAPRSAMVLRAAAE